MSSIVEPTVSINWRVSATGETVKSIEAHEATNRDRKARRFASVSGTEKGDPAKAMELLVDTVRGEGRAMGREWPMWIFMGQDCIRDVRAKCAKVLRTIDDWEDLSTTLEFDSN